MRQRRADGPASLGIDCVIMHHGFSGNFYRAAFFDLFEKEVSRAQRYETPLALIMADLDNFKDANDRYGHLAGDVVLAEISRRLRALLRVSDSIGRYGGEEFVILAPGCTPDAASLLAERFRLSISSTPIALASERIVVTMSFGVAATSDMSRASGLLRSADEALYRAKNSGKNRVNAAE